MSTKKYEFPRREEGDVSLPKIEGMQDITDSHRKLLYFWKFPKMGFGGPA
jgi:hypothetical protein